MAETKLELPTIPIKTEHYRALVNDAEKQGTNLATLVGEFLTREAEALLEWKVTPIDAGFGVTHYTLSRGTEKAIMLCRPQESFSVELLDRTPRTQYEWYMLNQRVITLVEAARTDQRAGHINPTASAQCHACGEFAETYAAWGTRCTQRGCGGTLFAPGTFPNPKET